MLPALPSPNTTTHHVHLDNNNAQHTHHSGSTTPKRNSSMIFRIEHLLPPALPTSSASVMPPLISETSASTIQLHLQAPSGNRGGGGDDGGVSSIESVATTLTAPTNGTRRTKASRSLGVYVKQFAPKDTISETIATLALMSSNYGENPLAPEYPHNSYSPHRILHQTSRTYCSIMQGVLRITPTVMRKIKLSEDIHSFNCLFELHDGDVRLRLVRDIVRDEELIAWFDEEITLFMSIPFLTPMNIQGNNRYTCQICQLTFETPNPLKIHLALSCGRHTLDILWIRLHYTLKSTALSQQVLPLPLLHRLPSIPTVHCTSTSAATTSPVVLPQTHRLSAFKPISPSSASQVNPIASSSTAILPVTTASLSLPLTSHSTNTISFLPSISSAVALTPMNLLQAPSTNPLNAAAQIEAIVSNMGASKQGHLCIYCGKVYSRKYGLKIHIRTHTGFKPLKCKFCLRPFGDPSNLNKHVRLHLQSGTGSTTGETIDGYKCHLCHKTLARRRDLQRHIESRHNAGS